MPTVLFQVIGNVVASTGLDTTRLPLPQIVDWLLTTSGLKFTITHTRDELIRLRHAAGERLSDLANEFGISPQRVHQIVILKQNGIDALER